MKLIENNKYLLTSLGELAAQRLKELVKKGLEPDNLQISALSKFLEKRKYNLNAKPEKIPLINKVDFSQSDSMDCFIDLSDNKKNLIIGDYKEQFSGVIYISGLVNNIWLDKELKKDGIAFVNRISSDYQWSRISNSVEKLDNFSKDEIFNLSIGLLNNIYELTIPEGVTVTKPILLKIDVNTTAQFFPILIYCHAFEQSHVKLLLDIQSKLNKDPESILSIIFIADMDSDSTLDLYEIQGMDMANRYFSHELVQVGNNASLDRFIMDFGAKESQRIFSVDLMEKGGEAKVTGIYFPHLSQKLGISTFQNHFADWTRSDLEFNGILDGHSNTKWDGNIYVSRETHGVDGYQKNNNLLLSPDARAQSIPGLEILTDDVKCSHGVTLSHIDPNQLFYLQSRGISRHSAEDLIKEGFLVSATSRIHAKEIENLIIRRLENYFANNITSC